MRRQDFHKFFGIMAGGLALAGLCQGASAAQLTSSAVALPSAEPGTQLNRAREDMERQRVLEQIQEDTRKNREKLETESKRETPANVPEVSFELTKLDIDSSEVLAPSEIDGIAANYLGRRVRLAELYEFVDKVNDLYSSKGYVTCRAILPPQRIRQGVVRVRLVEGRTGKVNISGNEHTRDGYVLGRVSLAEGAIANLKELNDDLMRFNGTNDAQMRISLKAGEAVGTTDYDISLTEPSNHVFRFYSDTNGYENNNRYRYGGMYTNRSLTGNRDHLNFTYLRSRGSDVLGVGYSFPVTASGTRLELNGGYNRTEIVNGWMQPLGVKGKAYNYSLAVRHPFIVQPDLRLEGAIEYLHQNSQTDLFVKTSSKVRWVDDETDKGVASLSLTHYKPWGILYHRHSASAGKHRNIEHQSTDFKYYSLDSMYFYQSQGRRLFQARLSGQYSFTKILPSAQRFYLGGANSVRGYEEGLINGENGVSASVEFSTPFWLENLTVFTFLDAGKVWGDSSFGDTMLIGAGVGARYSYKSWLNIDVGVGLPIKRTINEAKQDSFRVHATLTATY
jgi:hemolysin activation/secretion protein